MVQGKVQDNQKNDPLENEDTKLWSNVYIWSQHFNMIQQYLRNACDSTVSSADSSTNVYWKMI